MSSLTQQNMLDQVPSPFGRGMTTRIAAAAFLGLHSYDHYGQMVVYAARARPTSVHNRTSKLFNA